MSETIKNVGLYQQTLNNNIKFPIGNTGEDTAFTLNMGQIKTYMENNIQLNYSQILNTPAIGSGTVLVYQNGQLAGKFNLNQSEDCTISLNGGGGGGTGRWGDITGDINQQSDLIQLMDDKLNGLATVSRTGSYNDLTNRPTIGNGTITLRQAGQQKGNFTLNQTGSLNIDLDGVQYTETVTGNTPSIDVKANTIYKCTGTLTSLTLSDVANSQFESDIYFTTGTNCTLTYPPTIDAVVGPTTLKDDTKYVIAIKDFKMVIGMDGFDPSDYQTTVVNNHPNLAYGQTSTVGTINGTALTVTMPSAGTVNVVDSNPTLSWGNQSTVATIGGTAIHVTMPSNPTITNLYKESGATQTIKMSNVSKYVICTTPLTSLSITDVSRTAAPLYVYFTVATDDEVDINFSYSTPIEPLVFVGVTNSFIAGSYYQLVIKDGVCYVYEDGGGIHGFMPTPQVQADWNENNSFSDAYIQNKPTIPAAPVQSNWNESDSTSLAYIANKPTIPTLPSYTTETWTFTLSDDSVITRTVYIIPSA